MPIAQLVLWFDRPIGKKSPDPFGGYTARINTSVSLERLTYVGQAFLPDAPRGTRPVSTLPVSLERLTNGAHRGRNDAELNAQ